MKTPKFTRSDGAAWCALLIILIVAAIIRYGRLDLPLERDEGEYAYAGQLVLQGIPPYQDVVNMKFPGIYAAYALCLAVFGQSHQGIHLALLFINAVTTLLIFLLARTLVNRLCAVVSAASFALLSLCQSVQGLFANAEHFVILFVVAGLLVLVQGRGMASVPRLFISGLLLGLGFTMKQHGIAFVLLAAAYLTIDTIKQRPFSWAHLCRRGLAFSAGVLLVLAVLCLTMRVCGVFKSFWFWTFQYASVYVSLVPWSQAGKMFMRNFVPVLKSAPLLWLLTGLGLVCLFTPKIPPKGKLFAGLYVGFSLLSICPGFYFRPHYFVLLLPCAALLAGMAAATLGYFLGKLPYKPLSIAIPLMVTTIGLGQSLLQQREFLFQMSPFKICRSVYWLNPFAESLEIAEFIQAHTQPEDCIAVFGSEPQIFFYAQRRSASSHIYTYPMMEQHDFALRMQRGFIEDVESQNPKYVVYVGLPTSWLRRDDSHPEIFQWIDGYLEREELHLVGVVELREDEAVYHWESDPPWPIPSRYWVCLFERTS